MRDDISKMEKLNFPLIGDNSRKTLDSCKKVNRTISIKELLLIFSDLRITSPLIRIKLGTNKFFGL